ncbi:MAG: tetraacyldisaccharide 4'-kinase [Burkholderiales bacterium]|nr:tetraacyldisaccharide 4'-kinase [Burkholderiales bacterium]
MSQQQGASASASPSLSRLSSLRTTLLAGWFKHNWLTRLLWPLSLLFGSIAFLRRVAFHTFLKPAPLAVPVIVVGNIFVGGTGKTPLTIWLVEQLRAAGFTPGVISRGYGAIHHPQPFLVQADSTPQQVGDEPRLIFDKTACPLMVGRQRWQVAHALLQQFPQVDVIISDDGLQHYALPRQLEIMLFDQRGVGNGSLLPSGPLREGAGRRRDFTVVNGAQPADLAQNLAAFGAADPARTYAMQLRGTRAWQLASAVQPRQMQDLMRLPQQFPGRILAAAGIGHPERFFSMLAELGLQCETLALPDHFDFASNPFANYPPAALGLILITEKDAVKCAALASIAHDPRVWVVPVEAEIDPMLAQHIVEKCRGCSLA